MINGGFFYICTKYTKVTIRKRNNVLIGALSKHTQK